MVLQHGTLRLSVGFTEMLTVSFNALTVSHDQREVKWLGKPVSWDGMAIAMSP